MKLRLIRVYTNTFDLSDPDRIVTTNPRRATQHWWTVKVRAVSIDKAWSYVTRMLARTRHTPRGDGRSSACWAGQQAGETMRPVQAENTEGRDAR